MADDETPMVTMATSMQVIDGGRLAATSAPLTNQPLIDDLVAKMVSRKGYDEQIRAFTLSVCAGYAYSDVAVMRSMLLRIGLDARCVAVPMTVDAMYIQSTAYVIQSKDGRLVIVAYRGTELTNLISWLADADAESQPVTIPDGGRVHSGFYRNLRAGRFAVVDLVDKALAGKPIDRRETKRDIDARRVRTSTTTPVKAVYLTGHSFGGALAVMLGLTVTDRLAVRSPAQRNPDGVAVFARIAQNLTGVYTYGQPMIGNRSLAGAFADLPFRYRRYIHRNDLVPHLPPSSSGDFAHFGDEVHCDRRPPEPDRGLIESVASLVYDLCTLHVPARQTGLLGIVNGVASLAGGLFPILRSRHLHWSIAEHAPHNYIQALAPGSATSEFG